MWNLFFSAHVLCLGVLSVDSHPFSDLCCCHRPPRGSVSAWWRRSSWPKWPLRWTPRSPPPSPPTPPSLRWLRRGRGRGPGERRRRRGSGTGKRRCPPRKRYRRPPLLPLHSCPITSQSPAYGASGASGGAGGRGRVRGGHRGSAQRGAPSPIYSPYLGLCLSLSSPYMYMCLYLWLCAARCGREHAQ